MESIILHVAVSDCLVEKEVLENVEESEHCAVRVEVITEFAKQLLVVTMYDGYLAEQ